MKAEMNAFEARTKELAALLANVPDDVPDVLQSASAIYAKKVAVLTDALDQPEKLPQAAKALRILIESIVPAPGWNRERFSRRCTANCAPSSNGWSGKPLERPQKR